jgi:hypothetical protein
MNDLLIRWWQLRLLTGGLMDANSEVVIKTHKNQHGTDFSWSDLFGSEFNDGIGFQNYLFQYKLMPRLIKPKHLTHLNEFINFIPRHDASANYLATSDKIRKSLVAFLIEEFRCDMAIRDGLFEFFGSHRYADSTFKLTVLTIQCFYKYLINEGKYGESNPIRTFQYFQYQHEIPIEYLTDFQYPFEIPIENFPTMIICGGI